MYPRNGSRSTIKQQYYCLNHSLCPTACLAWRLQIWEEVQSMQLSTIGEKATRCSSRMKALQTRTVRIHICLSQDLARIHGRMTEYGVEGKSYLESSTGQGDQIRLDHTESNLGYQAPRVYHLASSRRPYPANTTECGSSSFGCSCGSCFSLLWFSIPLPALENLATACQSSSLAALSFGK